MRLFHGGRVVIVSDLHNDFYPRDTTTWIPFLNGYENDVLIIAGDTANSKKGIIHFFDYWKLHKSFRYVIMVDGNHEHYNNRNKKLLIRENIKNIQDALPSNVILLGEDNPSFVVSYEHDEIEFIGANGWYNFDVDNNNDKLRDYNMRRWPEFMNDYKNIGIAHAHYWGVQPSIYQLAKLHAELIDKTISKVEDSRTIFVVTHTAPHRDMATWKSYDQRWNDANAFYVNAFMTDVMKKYNTLNGNRISYWVNGHSHDRKEKLIEGITCISNPRGYPNENPTWQPLVLEI